MRKRVGLHIKGLVQGVGFRPFIYKLAHVYNLSGYVLNSTKGVEIEIEGLDKEIEGFLDDLYIKLPPLSRIDNLTKTALPLQHTTSFVIQKSVSKNTKNSPILPDMAICEDCLHEMRDINNPRFNYPFINCTNCGPRYSIIKDIPYDRDLTSMRQFDMCKSCQAEYDNPLDRRYHAQPISCKNCGPTLSFYDTNRSFLYKDDEAIKHTANYINQGLIVAIKGVGGFHLVCDATNEMAIKKLRIFKRRPFKPFAIMCKDTIQASLHVDFTQHERESLNSIEKPIVLMEKKQSSSICKSVAPQTSRLGIFLPNTPLHVLLFDFLHSPIIATSANLQGEPIITDKEGIDEKFGDILSGVLDYNREIIHSCDDSLLQMIEDKKLFLRVSRGIAPLTISYKSTKNKNILAVGAHTKNAIAFYIDGKIILSPYLGDMDGVKTYELFQKTIRSWKKFYDMEFDIIVHDNHPNYATTKWAKKQNIKTVGVNHYHAHILATLIDRKIPLQNKVLGVAWDGTGYGDDGSIWGGEFLVCKGDEYQRVAYFKPFFLLGGEKSIKHIDRIAFSLLLECGLSTDGIEDESFLRVLYEKGINSIQTSSVGRLFDAVCYLATGLKEASYDGQSGLLLESLYDTDIKEAYPLYMDKDGIIHYEEMFENILEDKQNPSKIATKFINALSKLIIKIAKKYSLPVILGGGVFQNKTLVLLVHEKAKKENIKLYFPQTLSPNDGSICVGQLAFGLCEA